MTTIDKYYKYIDEQHRQFHRTYSLYFKDPEIAFISENIYRVILEILPNKMINGKPYLTLFGARIIVIEEDDIVVFSLENKFKEDK